MMPQGGQARGQTDEESNECPLIMNLNEKYITNQNLVHA